MKPERFMVEDIDTDALASFGFSLGDFYGGEIASLRDDLIPGRMLTCDDEMFIRICRSCRKSKPVAVENIDNSGEAPC